jgi:hypothetical protein
MTCLHDEIGDSTLPGCILDRLVHKHRIEIRGDCAQDLGSRTPAIARWMNATRLVAGNLPSGHFRENSEAV